MIETQLLAPASNDTLFELMAGFKIIDALVREGFREHFELIEGGPTPFGRLLGPLELTIWWQRSIWRLLGHREDSRYRQALLASRMPLGALRPDFVIMSSSPRRIPMVEVKQMTVDKAKPERRGLREAMAYLDDANSLLSILPGPHALVIGWNATASPGLSRVVVTNQDEIGDAVRLVANEWVPQARTK